MSPELTAEPPRKMVKPDRRFDVSKLTSAVVFSSKLASAPGVATSEREPGTLRPGVLRVICPDSNLTATCLALVSGSS